MVCLTDLFATSAELLDTDMPADCAQDSLSFLGTALSRQDCDVARRTSMVNHSNFGEFAYRKGDWKLVYTLGKRDLHASRGEPTVAELYDLSSDIAEAHNLAVSEPERVKELTAELAALIKNGASRPGATGSNDCQVRFDITQSYRWVED